MDLLDLHEQDRGSSQSRAFSARSALSRRRPKECFDAPGRLLLELVNDVLIASSLP
jgi:hypothetical protein